MANHSPRYYVEPWSTHVFSRKNTAPWCISCFRRAPVLKRRENSMNQCTWVGWLVLQSSLTSLSVVIFGPWILLCTRVLLHLLYTRFPANLGWLYTASLYSTPASTCERCYSRVRIVAIVARWNLRQYNQKSTQQIIPLVYSAQQKNMYITLYKIQLCTSMYSMSSYDIKIHAIRIHISRSFICRISFPSVLFLGFSQTAPCVDHIDHCFPNAGSARAPFSGLCHDENSLRSLFKIIKIYRSVMIWSILVWYGQIVLF